MEYEYGIMWRGDEDMGLHRGPWTKEECEEWIDEWRAELSPNQLHWVDVFYIVRRPVGEWERV